MSTYKRFPAVKAGRLLRILESKPLCYRVARQRGSHRRLEARHYPPLTFPFHRSATVRPRTVRKILVNEVGLSVEEALELL
jgi:predicted RNA binding protein YcfA (HicA-like mRNA interferase family)